MSVNENQDQNNYTSPYSLEVRTVQANTISKLFEAVKGILTDANLEFLPNGLRIIAMDGVCNVMVHLKLHANKFEYYHCPEPVIVGMNMLNFFKVINTVGNDDILTFIVDPQESDKFQIKIENGDKSTLDIYKVKMIDLEDEGIDDIPPAEFGSVISLPSGDFQKYCRDMEHIGEKVDIRTTGKQLYMICGSDYAEQKKIIGESDMSLGFLKSTKETIQGIFRLKHLILFTKCTSLCNNVELFLKNDYPLIVRYTVSNMGEIKLCLAPCVENSIV
jgi:proliferating cell nuclear antigen